MIWPGILADYALDLTPALGAVAADHAAAIIKNNTVAGKLVGMPFFTDVGLLFYRTDLLEKYKLAVPVTWDELEQAAQTIQAGERAAGHADFWGFVWQGKGYEGLTCNALEWQLSHGAPNLVDAAGKVTVNTPAAVAALSRAQRWVGTITPKSVLTYQEEDARGVWQSGNAAFMRNWPYAYALGNAAGPDGKLPPIAGHFAVAPLPSAGGPRTGALGGWQLMVAKTSPHQAAALDFVRFMTSAAVQKRRALAGSYAPTIPSLYNDPEIGAKYPFFSSLQQLLINGAASRPSSVTASRYDAVSQAYFATVHDILSGQQTPAAGLAALQLRVEALLAK